jgi:preprotein translocase subunit SecF
MYFFGGPGIHGFTFVLLVGILVGTYSSVAIAAPILLFGNQSEPDSQKKSDLSSAQLQRAGT